MSLLTKLGTLLSEQGAPGVLYVVSGVVVIYVVKQVSATRPVIEWHFKDGGGCVKFPDRTTSK